MRSLPLSNTTRLSIVIGISLCFFIAEISVGFYTHSLALIADAFHYLNDLIGFVVALIAIRVSKQGKSPRGFSFGWQRAQMLGAFFNGVFLAALSLSIFLQALERFISIEKVEHPKLVLIVGSIGLGLNIISVLFLHGHGHDHGHGHGHPHGDTPNEDQPDIHLSINVSGVGIHADHAHQNVSTSHHHRDLGMMGVLIHVIGDAINNIGVIISALIIWFVKSEARYYADPAVSMAIAFMIFASCVPLLNASSKILLQGSPPTIDLPALSADLSSLPGILSVHELHVWRLNETKTIASVHVVTNDDSLERFMERATEMGECFHAWGVHSWTMQPELARRSISETTGSTAVEAKSTEPTVSGDEPQEEVRQRQASSDESMCRVKCAETCGALQCCD
ncbi:cation efflux protein [Eremomyces bilateralis CBS 781.70]|uniref:Cation efflux protein n=1 Tax=Eremomyces bilateralis CBS 781.70 TaxID=1392243 RepID=A0A6G1G746_9PEZI|nr:cation efflux protein [Eremomyces bilateralis CBS 781.70]KAF1813720.1 cation efflux protein [Eremomyces bilateralis CBS 781.70]